MTNQAKEDLEFNIYEYLKEKGKQTRGFIIIDLEKKGHKEVDIKIALDELITMKMVVPFNKKIFRDGVYHLTLDDITFQEELLCLNEE